MSYPHVIKTYMQTAFNVTKCANRRKGGLLKYVVVHYTGTDASAKNNCLYFGGGDRSASADYFIDRDGTIYKFNGNCAEYFSWHCGDGHGEFGITNSNSIGIEVVSAGEDYTAAQKKALRALVRAIMADYGVPASHVVRHYDASRKICPEPYCGSAAKDKEWKALHDYITAAGHQRPAHFGTAEDADGFEFEPALSGEDPDDKSLPDDSPCGAPDDFAGEVPISEGKG